MAAQKFIDLQEQLNEEMRRGHKAVLHLNGLIRKLHSLRAFVQMKNEEAKKQINEYVTKLSESLLEFRAEMLMELDAVQKDKFEHICKLRDSYEADIETFNQLFEEAEKYMQFDRRLHTERDRKNVQKLLDGIRELLDPPDEQEMADILHFEFRPSISVDDMGPHFLGRMETSLNKPENVDIAKDKAMLAENPYTEPAIKHRRTSIQRAKGRDMGTQTEAYSQVQPKLQIMPSGLYPNMGFQQPQQQQPYPMYGQTPTTMFYPCVTPVTPMYRPVGHPPPGFAGNAPLLYGSQVLSPVKPEPCSPASYPQNSGLGLYPNQSSVNMNLDMQKKAAAAASDVKAMLNKDSQMVSDMRALEQLPPKDQVNKPLRNFPENVEINTVSHTHTCKPNIVPKNTDSGVTEYKKEYAVKNANNDLDCYIVEPVNLGTIDLTESHKLESMTKPDNHELADQTDSCKLENLELSRESSSSLDSGIVSPPGLNINIKEKLSDILLPLKPLRKPLRLPKLAIDKLEGQKIHSAVTEEHSGVELESRRNVSEGVGEICEDADSRRKGPTIQGQKDAMDDDEQQSDKGKEGCSFRIAEITTSTPQSKGNGLGERICQTESNSCGARKHSLDHEGQGDAPDARLSASLNASPFRPRAASLKTSVNKPAGLQSTESLMHIGSKLLEQVRGDSVANTKDKRDIPDVCEIYAPVAAAKDANDNNCSQGIDKDVCENDWTEYSSVKTDHKAEAAEIKQEVVVKSESVVWTMETDTFKTGNKAIASKLMQVGTVKTETEEWTTESDTAKHTGCGDRAGRRNADVGDNEVQQVAEARPANKGGSTGDRCEKRNNLQKQTRQLAQRVRDFLGEGQSPAASYSSRLGAVQAHWLTNPGTDLCGSYLFQLGTDLNFPIGVTTDQDGNIIITDTGHGLIKKYDREGKLLAVIGETVSPAMKRPSAVVVGRNNELYVKDDICIHLFDRDGLYVTSIGKKYLARPFGLDMTHLGNLITLVTNPRQPTVVHLSPDGEQIWSYVYTPLLNAPHGSKCRFLAVADNSLIVSDLGLSQVYLTTLQGVYMGVFGTHGSGPLDFLEPSGVSVDNYGNVLIGDSKNNRIKMYRQNGQYMGKLQLDTAIIRPSGIHLTRDNRLIVVNFLQHHAKVFSLGPDTSTSHK